MKNGTETPPQLSQAVPLQSGRATAALQLVSPAEFGSVNCHVREGTATLVGRVSTYYLKQLAQESVRRLEGVSLVANQLIVCSPTRAVG